MHQRHVGLLPPPLLILISALKSPKDVGGTPKFKAGSGFILAELPRVNELRCGLFVGLAIMILLAETLLLLGGAAPAPSCCGGDNCGIMLDLLRLFSIRTGLVAFDLLRTLDRGLLVDADNGPGRLTCDGMRLPGLP